MREKNGSPPLVSHDKLRLEVQEPEEISPFDHSLDEPITMTILSPAKPGASYQKLLDISTKSPSCLHMVSRVALKCFDYDHMVIHNHEGMMSLSTDASIDNPQGTTITLTFLSLDEALSYFQAVYKSNWSSVPSYRDWTRFDITSVSGTHYIVPPSDLRWIPDGINADEVLDFDDVSEESFSDVFFLEDSVSKDRITRATRRRNHWTKDQLRPAQAFTTMSYKKEKALRDAIHSFKSEKERHTIDVDMSASIRHNVGKKLHGISKLLNRFDSTVTIDTRREHVLLSLQTKMDSFFKTNVHAISKVKPSHEVESPTTESKAISQEVTAEPTVPCKRTQYVNRQSGRRAKASKNIPVKKHKSSKVNLIPGKGNYRKFSPIWLEHGYGFGLLYKYF